MSQGCSGGSHIPGRWEGLASSNPPMHWESAPTTGLWLPRKARWYRAAHGDMVTAHRLSCCP